jgi:hypothetical protein
MVYAELVSHRQINGAAFAAQNGVFRQDRAQEWLHDHGIGRCQLEIRSCCVNQILKSEAFMATSSKVIYVRFIGQKFFSTINADIAFHMVWTGTASLLHSARSTERHEWPLYEIDQPFSCQL